MDGLPAGFTPDLPKDLPKGFSPDPHDAPEGFVPDAPTPKIPTALAGIKDAAASLIAHATMAGHQALRRGERAALGVAAVGAVAPATPEIMQEFDHEDAAAKLAEHLHKTALGMDFHPKDEEPVLNPAIVAMGPTAVKGLRAAQISMDASDPAIIRAAQFGKMAGKPLSDRIAIHTANETQHSDFAKAAIAPNPTPMEWGASDSISKTAADVKSLTRGLAAVTPLLKQGLTPSTMTYRRPGFASASNDDPSQMERGEEQAAGEYLKRLRNGPEPEPLSPEEQYTVEHGHDKGVRLAMAAADLIHVGFGSYIAPGGPMNPKVQESLARVRDYANSADADELLEMANMSLLVLGAGEGVKAVLDNPEVAKDLPAWAGEAYVPDRLKFAIRNQMNSGRALAVIPDEAIYNILQGLPEESQNAMIRSNPQAKRIVSDINRGASGEGPFAHLQGNPRANPFAREIPTSAGAVADQTLAASAVSPGSAELAQTYPSLYAAAFKGAPVPASAANQFGETMGALSRSVGNGPMSEMLSKGHFQGKFSRVALAKLDEAIRDGALQDAGAHPDTVHRHAADLYTAASQPAEAAAVLHTEKEVEDAAVAARKKNSDDVWRMAQEKKADLEKAPPPPPPPPSAPRKEDLVEKIEAGAIPEEAIQEHLDAEDAPVETPPQITDPVKGSVPDLVKPGDIITAPSGGLKSTYKVIGVSGPYHTAYHGGKGHDVDAPENYHITAVDPGTEPGKNGKYKSNQIASLGSLVSRNGKIYELKGSDQVQSDKDPEYIVHRQGEDAPKGLKPEGDDFAHEDMEIRQVPDGDPNEEWKKAESEGWTHIRAHGSQGIRYAHEEAIAEMGPNIEFMALRFGGPGDYGYQVYARPKGGGVDVHGLRPAFKVGKNIIVGEIGQHHQDVINDHSYDPKVQAAMQLAKDADTKDIGFADAAAPYSKGAKLYTRADAKKNWGFEHSEELNAIRDGNKPGGRQPIPVEPPGNPKPGGTWSGALTPEEIAIRQATESAKTLAMGAVDMTAAVTYPGGQPIPPEKIQEFKEGAIRLAAYAAELAAESGIIEGEVVEEPKAIGEANVQPDGKTGLTIDYGNKLSEVEPLAEGLKAALDGSLTKTETDFIKEKLPKFIEAGERKIAALNDPDSEGYGTIAQRKERVEKIAPIVAAQKALLEAVSKESDPYSMEAVEAASGGKASPPSSEAGPAGPDSSSSPIVERAPEEVKASADKMIDAELASRGLKNTPQTRVQLGVWFHERRNAIMREMGAEMRALPESERQAYLDAQSSDPRSAEGADLAKKAAALVEAYPEVAAQIPHDHDEAEKILKGFDKPAPAEWREGNYKSGKSQVRGVIAGGYVYGVKGGSLTHIPTGLRVTTEDTEAEAKAVAEALMAQVPELNDPKNRDISDEVFMKALRVRNAIRAALNPGKALKSQPVTVNMPPDPSDIQDWWVKTSSTVTYGSENPMRKGLNSPAPGATIPPDAAEAPAAQVPEPLGPESLLQIAGGQPAPVQVDAEVGVPEGVPGVDGEVPGGAGVGAEGTPPEAGVLAGAGGDGSGESRDGDLPPGAGRGNVAQEPGNFRITAETELEPDGKVARFNANVEAIKTLRAIEADGRMATPAEQAILVKYVGWGQLESAFHTYYGEPAWQKRAQMLQEFLATEEYDAAEHSTQNAHYTSRDIVGRIYKAIDRLGFSGGRILEPAMGIGHFFGMLPDSMGGSKMVGVELDPITARIARQLYQHADVRQAGFQAVKLPNGYFDMVVGNPPFSEVSPNDPEYNKFKYPLHDYFIVKSMDKLREGGVMAIITSRYSMDKLNASWRDRVFEKADLLGAIRLPDTAFKGNADTSVVTDVLFFRKRLAGEPAGDSAWLQSEAKEGAGYSLNRYFSENPHMVVGEIGTKRGAYSANDFTVSHKGDFLPTLDAAIARLPEGVYSEADTAPKEDALSKSDAAAGVKKGGHVVRDGKVLQRKGDEMVEKKGADAARVGAMIDLLDTMNKTIAAQQNEEGEAAVKASIASLNKAYDKFTKKYGSLNDRANKTALQDDPNLPKLLALENKSAAGFTKADIFEKPVIRASKKIDVMSDPKDALNVVLNDVGRVDLKRISALTGKPIAAVKEDLKGLIYQNPDGGAHEIADVYLSGNVKQKLIAARAAAELDPKSYAENVPALEAVQPKDLEAHEITANLGAPWIPASVIADFVDHLTGVHRSVKVQYMPLIGRWGFEQSYAARGLSYSVGNSSTWGTARMPAVEIVKSLLDGKQPTIYDGSGDSKVVNQPETDAARQKMEEVEEKFKSWIFEDKERRDPLLKLYNDTQNTHRVVKFNGSHLTMPGSNPAWKWRPHQLDAVWRAIISKNNMGLFHEVGTGKTGVMAGIAMESRRLGIAKKPMIAALNANVGSIIKDFRHIYPGAKILTFEAGDLSPATRGEFMSRIATGDWDAVIVTHPSFGKLPMSRDAQLEFYRKQVVEITGAMEQARMAEGKTSRMVKDLAKAADRIETKMEKLGEKLAKDETITFEELGVDMLIVDESQEFKNLYFPTSIARGVKGLGSGSDTGRSFDMYMKTQHISKLNNGRGVVFATGTPITNSMSEVYTLQRYLASDELHAEGLNHFDAWARTYGKIVNSFELKPSGKGYRVVQRFAKFQNVSELMRRYLQFADIVRADTTKIKLPKKAGDKTRLVVVPASAMQKAFIDSLVKRYENLKPGGPDNALLITTDGRKAALDMRLIDKTLPDDPGSKLNKAVDIAFGNWQKGKEGRLTQAIFCDLGVPGEDSRFNVYGDIRSKLIERGVPKDEIAFIHDAKNDNERQALFAKVNAGKVRVLIGSRTKMGIGANFQTLLAHSLSIDIPWRPDQIEQMEGRSIRQGNTNEEVGMDQLATENTFDTYIFSLLEGKAAGFAPVVRGDYNLREVDDLSGAALSFQEAKAASSGNPMVVEKIKIGGDIRKLNSLAIAHQKALVAAQSEMALLPQESEALTRKIGKLKDDAAMSLKHSKDFAMTVSGKDLTDRKEAGEAILAAVNGAIATGSVQALDLGTYRGFRLVSPAMERGNIHIIGKEYHLAKAADTAIGTIASIDSAISPDKLSGRAEEVEKNVAAMNKRISELAGEVSKPFKFADKLRELKEREKVIDKELGADQSDKGAGDPGAGDDDGGDDGGPEGDLMFPEDAAEEDRGPMAVRSPARPAEGLPEKGVYDDLSAPGAFERMVSASGTEMPLEMPELVSLIKDVSGKYPIILKSMGNRRGAFYPGTGEIKMAAPTFADIDQAAKTLAHELGHLVAWLSAVVPGEELRTMARGNIIGQLMSLERYLRDSFPDLEGTNREFRKELIAASKFWRPWDRDAADAKEIKYRDSSKEIFADALSMFLNSPGKLEKMAPTFYAALLDNMDRKPEFKKAWLDIQDMLHGERDVLLENRERDIREMGAKMEDLMIRKQAEKGRQLQSIGELSAQGSLDRYSPIMRIANIMEARGEVIPDEFNPKWVYQEGDMVPEDWAALDLAVDRAINPLFKKHGITSQDMHVYGFFNRILHDRSDIGNPLGFDPKAAQDGLDYLKRKFGDEKYAALVEAAQKVQEIYWPVYEESRRLGVIGREVWDTKIVPNRGNYVTFSVLEYLEKTGFIAAGIHQQVGTMKEIGDTFVATHLKVKALISRNVDQKNKLATKWILENYHPDEISRTGISRLVPESLRFREKPGRPTPTEVVRTGEGPGIERPGVVPGTDIKKGVIRIWEDGRSVAYDVDPYIAEMHEKMKPAQMNLVHRVLALPNSWIRLFYTSYNAGFVFGVSPIRYFEKTWKGLSDVNGGKGVSAARLLAEYVKALPTAWTHAIGNPNDLAQKLLADKVLNVTGTEELDLVPSLNSYASKLKRYQLAQENEKDLGLGQRILRKVIMPLRQFGHAMQVAADTQTSAWKVAAATVRMKAGESGPDMAYHVRNYSGIPFMRTRGTLAKTGNDLGLFANALQRHFVTALQVLNNPKSRSGARFKTAAVDVLPSMLQAMAALGFLGASLKQFYRRASKYDKRHNTLIPLGSIAGGKFKWKAVYVPVPHDDMGRLAHALTYEMIMAAYNRDPKEVAAMFGELYNIIPSMTPSIEIPRAWAQEYTGGRYFDQFRQRTAIPDRVEKIGGWMKFDRMVEWTTNSLGLSNFASYDPASRTTTEAWIQGTPWVNRLLRVTDFGAEEELKAAMDNTPGGAEIYSLHEKKNQQAGLLSNVDHRRLAELERAAKVYRRGVKKDAREEMTPKSALRAAARARIDAQEESK